MLSFTITALCCALGVDHLPHMTELERAIHMVESGGRITTDEPILGDWCPRRKVYRSRGPLQISEACWRDSGVPGNYEMVDDLAYSIKVFRKYQKRYAVPHRIGNMDINEAKSRIWNGGPNGHRKVATEKYWHNVERRINGK